jgi:O-antigen/teichoic acid export membrane protein
MNQSRENNKRIAKNTLLLYVRMLFTMGVSLYTSRVVLATLGVEDFGIYNVVGGIVVMFAFLNNAMIASSQRFISYELGKQNYERLKKVFSLSVTIHFCIALIVLLIAETLGLWFLNTKLNIISERMEAANWVYQCSIFAFLVGIISVPYNACIVAHEHMNVYAAVTIIDVVMKLAIAYIVMVESIDKLKLYAILVLAVAIIIRMMYTVYCKYRFKECTYHFLLDRDLFKRMFSFAGWSFFGNFSISLKDQGSNIILNIFFGTAVNAARGIAFQVNSAISSFAGNFQMAINPQITKTYATGNYEQTRLLIARSCRYSFYLFAIFTIPIYINIKYILNMWLIVTPEYTDTFLRLVIWISVINSVVNPIVTAIQANGNVRKLNLMVGGIFLGELPLSYLILKLGCLPYSVLYISLFTTTICVFVRFLIMKRYIAFSGRYFVFSIFLKNITLFAVLVCVLQYVQSWFSVNFLSFVMMTLFSFLFVAGIFYLFGLEKRERYMIRKSILKFIQKSKKTSKL